MVPGEQSVGSARMTQEALWVLVLVAQMPTHVPTGQESERSRGILQAIGKADLIAKTTEIIKGRVRFLARIKERHLRNQRNR